MEEKAMDFETWYQKNIISDVEETMQMKMEELLNMCFLAGARYQRWYTASEEIIPLDDDPTMSLDELFVPSSKLVE